MSKVEFRRRSKSFEDTIKIVVVGDSGIGKTCLARAIAHKSNTGDYEPTTIQLVCFKASAFRIDHHLFEAVVCKQPVSIMLMDTAGQSDYQRLRILAYENSDVIFVCFSLALPASFRNVVTKWLPELDEYCNVGKASVCTGTHSAHVPVPYFLIGTKLDVRNHAAAVGEHMHCIARDDALQLAKRFGASGYFECSPYFGENIGRIFEKAVERVLSLRQQQADENSSNTSKSWRLSFLNDTNGELSTSSTENYTKVTLRKKRRFCTIL